MIPLRIFGWAADQAGCRHYRLTLPLDQLRRRGHQISISSRMLTDTPEQSDLLIGQRVCKPGPTHLWQTIARRPHHPTLVYEIDDDLFDIDPTGNPIAYGFYQQPGIQDNIRANIAAADLVTVSTLRLAEVVHAWNPNVAILPNCVPQWLLHHTRPNDSTITTLGWQGSATHRLDWEGPNRQVERFLRRRGTRTELHLMGAPPDNAPHPFRHTGWTADIDHYYRLIDWDIALAPLRPHPFNQSKSDIRVIEAQALGIPVVASATGPYERTIRHGQTGMLVRRDHEWGQHLAALIDQPDLYGRIATAGRRHVAQHRTIEAQAHLWEELYLSCRR